MEVKLAELTFDELKKEKNRLRSELSQSEDKIYSFYNDLYLNISNICHEYHDLNSNVIYIKDNIYYMDMDEFMSVKTDYSPRNIKNRKICQEEISEISDNLLTTNIQIHIFNKRFHEASIIILAFEYILSSPEIIEKFQFSTDTIFHSVTRLKSSLMAKISDETNFNSDMNGLRKIISSYLILSKEDIHRVLNFYLNTKRTIFQNIIAGVNVNSFQNNVKNIIITFITTVKNSAFFSSKIDHDSIIHHAFNFMNDLEYDEEFKILNTLLKGFDEFCTKLKYNLSNIDESILQSTIKIWMKDCEILIEPSLFAAIDNINLFTSLCEAFLFTKDLKNEINQFPFLFSILRNCFTERSEYLIKTEIENIFMKYDSIMPEYSENDMKNKETWSYECYEKLTKPLFQELDTIKYFEKSSYFKCSNILFEINNFVSKSHDYLDKLEGLEIDKAKIIQYFHTLVESLYRKYSKKWSNYAKDKFAKDCSTSEKIIKVSEFSVLVKTSFEIAFSNSEKDDFKIKNDNFNPIRIWFKILSIQLIKDYVGMFENPHTRFMTNFGNYTIKTSESNEKYAFKIPAMMSNELFELISRMLNTINSSINVYEYTSYLLKFISSYINKHLWGDLAKIIEFNIEKLTSHQIIQILFDIKVLYFILTQNQVTENFYIYISSLLVSKLNDYSPMLPNVMEFSISRYLFQKMFIFRSIMSDTAIKTVNEMKIQSKNEKKFAIESDQNTSLDRFLIKSNTTNEHLEYL